MWDSTPIRFKSRLHMRMGSMSQLPGINKIHNSANFWRTGYYSFRLTDGHSSGSETKGFGGRNNTIAFIGTKPEVSTRTTLRNKSSSVRHEIVEGTVSSSTILNINSTDLSEIQKIQYSNDVRQMISENKDLANLVSVLVFDLETTGFSKEKDRIIEIAIQDLSGGKNSTFQALVNPGRYIANAHIHGITNDMVIRADVPRMEELIPILVQYVKSRQEPGGYVLLVAHNARSFDVPFLVKEFSRSSIEIPENWMFVDSLALVHEKIKSEGLKLPSASLQALREHYKIPLHMPAHRALSDVNTLSLILQKLTFDMKMSISGLVERSFTPSELNSSKRKKKK